MNKFESILLDYGRYVFIYVFQVAKEKERYEDCAVMQEVMNKYNIPDDTSVEDWISDLWRIGYSGETALSNLNEYKNQVLKRIGYNK